MEDVPPFLSDDDDGAASVGTKRSARSNQAQVIKNEKGDIDKAKSQADKILSQAQRAKNYISAPIKKATSSAAKYIADTQLANAVETCIATIEAMESAVTMTEEDALSFDK